MCVVCGCADSGEATTKTHEHAHGHAHDHGHVHVDPTHGDLHFGAGAARVSVPGMSQARTVKLEADILGENRRIARQNRHHFEAHGVTALNLLSSPGSGKTTLLCATIEALKARAPGVDVAVIEGDQQTSFDADRIRATGAPAIQVNTGKGCHLDAPMVAEAFGQLHSHDHHHHHDERASLLFIENVGNLVCPALWDLGEAAKVVVLSVTEGEDKPLKYPDMFAAAELMVLNKVDLLPHLRFDVQRCIEMARRVNPTLQVLQLSATTGEGMDAWLDWLLEWTAPEDDSQAALRARVAALEAELAQARAALER
ncbi:hydrogenase nickel incorporation protein HypB [Roseateles puraquae]|uniref:Hydrogenase maturation factor HypB n=1 Tax=Roseateles puraquae TaxID=431059 RepID=A0A254N550_9BURK|nr:hydrogenase nickel incorporation protein HypB [Roseateles puraquae]MDG0854340.1 hydrogenase accessory protein HypB [Roseateles puraquae]OWR00745.1 hydrogenase accessory protein HypB [Roseateles puraquae]RTL46788.1 MAG: hydrogenase accessory protein HypB [Burkholderiales bacterium]